MAELSAAFFGYPSRKLQVVGVTGTDGKTTTSTLIHSILRGRGPQSRADLHDTRRDRRSLLRHRLPRHHARSLRRAAIPARHGRAGTEVAVLETTSHALDQGRVLYVDYDVAVVTNVTHEHMDWHGYWENYMGAKAKLFQALNESYRKPSTPKVSVINADDKSYAWLKGIPADMHYVYGLDRRQQPDITAEEITYKADGTHFTVQTPVADFPVSMHLPGKHNVYNAMASIGAALSLGASIDAIQKGIAAVEQIKGRMEWIDEARQFGFDVVVDFAHTPNALEKTLEFARRLVAPRKRSCDSGVRVGRVCATVKSAA